MKTKHLLLMCAAAWACTGSLRAQQSIPNGNFENWNSTPYDEPGSWITSNMEGAGKGGVITVFKTTGVSGSAIKLQTVAAGGDTIGGFFVNSQGNPEKGEGGMPYSQQPTGITLKAKVNMVNNDSAILLVIFKKSGMPINNGLFKIGGKNQTTFTTLNFSFILPVVPDSVIIGAASSDLMDTTKTRVAAGSSIEIDDMSFTGTGITQTIPNGNFDTWTAKSLDMLIKWNAFGEVSRSTDKQKGTYAAVLKTMDFGGGNIGGSGISTGNMGGGSNPAGGNPFTNQFDTIIGYYKLTSVGGDSAFISAGLMKNGSPIGGAYKALPAAAAYTLFEMPLGAITAPDSIRVDIGLGQQGAHMGTMLTIDEVQLKSQKLNTGMLSFERNALKYVAYPNPVRDQLTVTTNLAAGKESCVTVMDATGRMIVRTTADDSQFTISTSALLPGIYFYMVTTSDGETVKSRFVKE